MNESYLFQKNFILFSKSLQNQKIAYIAEILTNSILCKMFLDLLECVMYINRECSAFNRQDTSCVLTENKT